MSERIEYIDVAKGIGILLVYVGHCSTGTPDISSVIEWIYAFHMPLFFFASGLLFPREKMHILTFYRNKFASLVIPYILFSIIHYVTFKMFHMPAGAIGIVLHGWGSNALWFIPILLLANIAQYHIVFGKWYAKLVSILSIIMLLIWKSVTNDWLPYCVSELPWFYMCLLTGYLMKSVILKLNSIKYQWVYGVIGLIILTLFVFCIAYPYNENYRHQDNDVFCWIMRYGIGILGSISVILISMSIATKKTSSKVLSWFGTNSLVILCTHQLFYKILQTVNYQPIIRGGYNHLIVWALVVCVILIYNKYFLPIIKKIHS